MLVSQQHLTTQTVIRLLKPNINQHRSTFNWDHLDGLHSFDLRRFAPRLAGRARALALEAKRKKRCVLARSARNCRGIYY